MSGTSLRRVESEEELGLRLVSHEQYLSMATWQHLAGNAVSAALDMPLRYLSPQASPMLRIQLERAHKRAAQGSI